MTLKSVGVLNFRCFFVMYWDYDKLATLDVKFIMKKMDKN